MNHSDYPTISVVTPSFNQGKYIEDTILSVLDQGYPNYEFFICDAGSKDETVEVIKKYRNTSPGGAVKKTMGKRTPSTRDCAVRQVKSFAT